MKILITGSTGYLGSQLADALDRRGHSLVLLARPHSSLALIEHLFRHGHHLHVIEGLDSISDAFEGQKIDGVIHSATNYGRGDIAAHDLVDVNVRLPLAVMEAATRSGCSFFVNIDTSLPRLASQYAFSKKQFTDWVQFKNPSMAFVNLVVELFYGPGEGGAKFVTWIVRQLLSGVPGLDLTAGQQKRDFIYIDDLVRAIVALTESAPGRPQGFHSFGVGTGQNRTIRDVVDQTARIVGSGATELRYGVLPYREHEPMESHCDTSELIRMGWKPATDFDEGLRRVIEFEKRRQAAARNGA